MRLIMCLAGASIAATSGFAPTPRGPLRRSLVQRSRRPSFRALAAAPPDANAADAAAPAADDTSYPTPVLGDVVMYPDPKWKDEVTVGMLRNLQYIATRGQWLADVTPLIALGDGSYQEPSRRRGDTDSLDAALLAPLPASYVRTAAAWRVPLGSDGATPLTAAPGFRLSDYALPTAAAADPAKAAKTLAQYDGLKTRILRDTLLFGAAGTLVAAVGFTPDLALVYGLGLFGSLAYLLLLARATDRLGTGAEEDPLSKARLGVPFALLVVLVARRAVTEGLDDMRLFNFIPAQEYFALVLGFVSYRLPLFFREITNAVKPDELLDMMPGSAAYAAKVLRDGGKPEGDALAAVNAGLSPVVVVSGPRATGKSTLVRRLVAEDERFAAPAWCTAKVDESEDASGVAARAVGPGEYERLAAEGEFVHEFVSPAGVAYGLLADDLRAAAAKGGACVLDADVDLTKAVATVPDARLVGVWVSLDSLPAIEARLTVRAAELGEGPEWVERGLRKAVEDIEYGVTCGVFEFTIINSDVESSMVELRNAARYAFM